MANVAKQVDDIRNTIRRGYPNGLDTREAAKMISVLVKRVTELERVCIPFVKIGISPTYNDPMVQVLHQNCADIANAMDREQSIPMPAEEIYYPAE